MVLQTALQLWARLIACFATAGSTAPVQLSSAVREWVAGRRKRVQAIMGSAAGIVRTQIDMQAALQDMMQLSLEAQVGAPLLVCIWSCNP